MGKGTGNGRFLELHYKGLAVPNAGSGGAQRSVRHPVVVLRREFCHAPFVCGALGRGPACATTPSPASHRRIHILHCQTHLLHAPLHPPHSFLPLQPNWYTQANAEARAVLKREKKRLCNANMNEPSRGRRLPHGHGTFATSKVGGWRCWAVGWQLVAVDGGWQRLAVGGWRRLAVVGSWRLAAVGGWQLVAVGSWQWSPGAVFKGSLNSQKNWGFLRTALCLRLPIASRGT